MSQASHYLIVGEVHNADIMLPERLIPLQVIVHLVLVYLTIDFNCQSCPMTIEIDNKPGDDLLPPKVNAVNLIAAYRFPEFAFRRSQVPPELLRKLNLVCFDSLTNDNIPVRSHAANLGALD
jgi:hypothetical protein